MLATCSRRLDSQAVLRSCAVLRAGCVNMAAHLAHRPHLTAVGCTRGLTGHRCAMTGHRAASCPGHASAVTHCRLLACRSAQPAPQAHRLVLVRLWLQPGLRWSHHPLSIQPSERQQPVQPACAALQAAELHRIAQVHLPRTRQARLSTVQQPRRSRPRTTCTSSWTAWAVRSRSGVRRAPPSPTPWVR